jgi:Bacterial PH domain
VRRKPVLRVRRSGALVIAALIALVGTVPLAGARGTLAPILVIPLLVLIWAWRAGTDVYPDALRVRALFGSTVVPWSRVTELAPDRNGRVSALLDNGNVIRLTGVTTANLPAVIAAGGQKMSPDAGDEDPTDAEAGDEAHDGEAHGYKAQGGDSEKTAQ